MNTLRHFSSQCLLMISGVFLDARIFWLPPPAFAETLFLEFVTVSFGTSAASSALSVGTNSARILGNDVDFSLWLLCVGASEASRRHSG
jgi:hypothetical protein